MDAQRAAQPPALATAREFLLSYKNGADLQQTRNSVRNLMGVNATYVTNAIAALEALAALPPGDETILNLVLYDANEPLDDPSDQGAKQYLAELALQIKSCL